MSRFSLYFIFIVILSSSFTSSSQQKELLLKQWELIEVKMDKFLLTEEDLKIKRNNVIMEFRANGTCLLIPAMRQVKVKTNQWKLSEDEKILIITSVDEFERKVNQKFQIEELSGKKLVLSVGDKADREVYTYKALKKK